MLAEATEKHGMVYIPNPASKAAHNNSNGHILASLLPHTGAPAEIIDHAVVLSSLDIRSSSISMSVSISIVDGVDDKRSKPTTPLEQK